MRIRCLAALLFGLLSLAPAWADTVYLANGRKFENVVAETTETEETETAPPAEGDPVAGKEVFLGASACGTCHTLADAGTSGTVGPNLDDLVGSSAHA